MLSWNHWTHDRHPERPDGSQWPTEILLTDCMAKSMLNPEVWLYSIFGVNSTWNSFYGLTQTRNGSWRIRRCWWSWRCSRWSLGRRWQEESRGCDWWGWRKRLRSSNANCLHWGAWCWICSLCWVSQPDPPWADPVLREWQHQKLMCWCTTSIDQMRQRGRNCYC